MAEISSCQELIWLWGGREGEGNSRSPTKLVSAQLSANRKSSSASFRTSVRGNFELNLSQLWVRWFQSEWVRQFWEWGNIVLARVGERRTLPETRIFEHCQNCGFSAHSVHGPRPVALAGSAPSSLSFLSDEQLTDKWAQLSLASPAQNDCHKVDK